MSDDPSKKYYEIHKIWKIKIKKFCTLKKNGKISARFPINLIAFDEYCDIEIYPNGISPKHREYVSVEIFKFPDQEEMKKWCSILNFNIFLGVIDINGSERCRQSFAQENVTLPFHIPRFLKRSFLLNLADELLPEGTLTIRCELVQFYDSISIVNFDDSNFDDSSEWSYKIEEDISESNDYSFDVSNKSEQNRKAFKMLKIVSFTLGIYRCFVSIFDARKYFMNFFKDVLAGYDAYDNIWQTYLDSHEIFQKYLFLKEEVRNIMNKKDLKMFKIGFEMLLEEDYEDIWESSQSSNDETGELELYEDESFLKSLIEEKYDCEKNNRLNKENIGSEINETPNGSLFVHDLYEDESISCDISEDGENFVVMDLSDEVTKENDEIHMKSKLSSNDNETNEGEEEILNYYKERSFLYDKIGEGQNFFGSTISYQDSISNETDYSYLNRETWKKPDTLLLAEVISELIMKRLNVYEQWRKKISELTLPERTLNIRDKVDKLNLKKKKNIFWDRDRDYNCNIYKLTDLEKLLEICENIRNILHCFLDVFLFSRKIYEKDEEATKILQIVDPKKTHFTLRTEHGNDSAGYQTQWNFYIETMDGITFKVPFEDGKETLGSKLISNSEVFERMLKNPMREQQKKSVKLQQTESDAFINFLEFSQTKNIGAETLTELCKVYEFADEYDIKELMTLCADKMSHFFSLSNIDEIEDLAHLHADEHLTKLVESFKQQSTKPFSGLIEFEELLTDEKSIVLNTESKEDFNFYQ